MSIVKSVLVYQINEAMRSKKITKSALAKKMKTSRAALDRLLDPDNESVTLNTLVKLAEALGKQLRIELI